MINSEKVTHQDWFLKFPNLEWLEISLNTIDLPVGIFDEIPNLKRLDLIENKMEMINNGSFSKLKNLEILNLEGNKLIEIDDNTFDELESNTEMTTLPDGFLSNLKMLQQVLLHTNGFKFLPENLFRNSISLIHINLNSNYLKTLPQNIFKSLSSLNSLEINNNLIETLPDGIFEDMSNLKKLDLSGNKMVSLTKDLFKGLTNLIQLNMERNLLKYMDEMSLFPIKHLSIARFSHNRLKFYSTTTKSSPFHNNQFLRELHLSNNSIDYFLRELFIPNYHLKLLNLSHNYITTLPTSNLSVPAEEMLIDVRYNKIKTIFFNLTDILRPVKTYNPDVIIFVEHNPLLCDCNLYHLLLLRNSEKLLFVYHIKIELGNVTCIQPNGAFELKVNELSSDLYACPEDEYFNIEPKCQIGCNCLVKPEDEVRIIDCSYRKMFQFSIDMRKVNFLGNNPIILNLNGNLLTRLPSIKPLKVTDLLLSHNLISVIRVSKLPVNLQNFTISGNPIKCDCVNEDFYNFVKLKHDFYPDLREIKCPKMETKLYKITIWQLCDRIEPRYNIIYSTLIAILIIPIIAYISYIFFKKYRFRRQDPTVSRDSTASQEMLVQYSAAQPEVVNIIERPEEGNLLEQAEEGSVLEQAEEGSVLEQAEEGSNLEQAEEGSNLEQAEEGSVLEQAEEGSVLEQAEEGSNLEQAEEGSNLEQAEEGSNLEQAEEGSNLEQAEEGSVLEQAEEGSNLEQAEEGSNLEQAEEGSNLEQAEEVSMIEQSEEVSMMVQSEIANMTEESDYIDMK
ncbi:protein toll-like [Polistes fuscatus]|uniref:protein toll-like n=1 Tax=Polistes fuscatus TaxID=30207 RepID=UPI001CA903A2|nr:protein toll-like [Polistes fuscatus]